MGARGGSGGLWASTMAHYPFVDQGVGLFWKYGPEAEKGQWGGAVIDPQYGQQLHPGRVRQGHSLASAFGSLPIVGLDRTAASRRPVGHRLGRLGIGLAKARWMPAPMVFLYRPEADSIMGAEVPGDGAGPHPSLPRRFHRSSRDGLSTLSGWPRWRAVVAGARLGESADALGSGRRGLIKDGRCRHLRPE